MFSVRRRGDVSDHAILWRCKQSSSGQSMAIRQMVWRWIKWRPAQQHWAFGWCWFLVDMLAAVHPQSCGVVATWSFFSQIKKRRLATWTPRPCHGDDGLFPAAGEAATTTPAAAMQKTRKRAVDGEPNVMENLDQITTNKSLFKKSPATKLALTNGTPPSTPHGF